MGIISKSLIGTVAVMAFVIATSPSEAEKAQHAKEHAAAVQKEKDRFAALPVTQQQLERRRDIMKSGWTNQDNQIKRNLRDPDSYVREGENIIVSKDGNKFTRQVVYRAKNGFGGYVRNTAEFTYVWNNTTRDYD